MIVFLCLVVNTNSAFARRFLAVSLTVSQMFDQFGFYVYCVIAMIYHSVRRQGTVIFDDKMTEKQQLP